MAWIADPKALRTYDPERGLELRRVGGGSDGSLRFAVHSIGKPDEVLAGFSVHGKARYATEEEKSVNPDLQGIYTREIRTGLGPTGWIIKGYSLEESKKVIREAMLAYRDAHGAPVGPAWVYDVKAF